MKHKTKKIVAKRFRITKTGKVLHRGQGARHLRRKKRKSHQRRQGRMARLTNAHLTKVIKRFIAGSY